MPAVRETARSTAQRTCSLVSGSGTLDVLAKWTSGAAGETGIKMGGAVMGSSEVWSMISMDRTTLVVAKRISDSSAVAANLHPQQQKHNNIRMGAHQNTNVFRHK